MVACLFKTSGFGPLFLRLAVGAVFVGHGWQKFANGLEHFAGSLEKMGLPVPMVQAWLAAGSELVGGGLLILGLGTRLAAIPLLITMGVAFTVHMNNGFFLQNGGFEYVSTLFAALLSLLITGGGAFSADWFLTGGSASAECPSKKA